MKKIIMFNFTVMLLVLLSITCFSNIAYGSDEKIISADLVSPAGFDLPVILDQNLSVSIITSELEFPTAMEFIGNDILVLEKNGEIHLIKNESLIKKPVLKLDVDEWRENGLFGILVKEDMVYLRYSTLNEDNESRTNWIYKYQWVDEELIKPVLIKNTPAGVIHNGGPMILDSKGNILTIFGDIDNPKQGPFQNQIGGTISDTGVIMTIDPIDEYYAIGIRNGYGLTLDPVTGFVWDTENGPAFYDEINLVEKGFNSGSDKIMGHTNNEIEKISAFSENIFLPERWYNFFVQILKGNDVFSNFNFGYGKFQYSEPEFTWVTPVSPTSIHFIQSPKFTQYNNSVLVGDFNTGSLYKFNLNENRDGFVFESDELQDLILHDGDKNDEIVFGQGFAGITDIKKGPDDNLYIVSIGSGTIFKIEPEN